MVFVPKYRHAIFEHTSIKDCCFNLFREVEAKQGSKYGFKLIEIGMDIDHAHLLVQMNPICNVANVARILKGNISRELFKQFPWLRKKYFWGGHLWSPSYFFGAAGRTTYEMIKRYVQSQGKQTSKQIKLGEFLAA